MRHTNIKVWALAGLLGCAMNSTAQVSQVGNNVITLPPYVGCDANSTQPLRVKTEANYNIDWYTNAIQRMQLTKTLTGQAVNGYTTLDLSGHLGIGNFNAPVYTPLTMLHLDSMGSEVAGYRSYMGTGVLMTSMSDMMYVGLKRLSDDRINSVINWADNAESDPTYGPDALTFVFTSEPDNTRIAGQQHGLEVARMIPAASGNEGFMGIGDFQTAGLQPTERLDLLDGKLRIRDLPTDPIASSLTRFLVVDDTPGPNFGVVKWRNVPTGTGTGCEWTLLGLPGSNSNIATAYNGNPGCPQGDKSVGIGTPTPIGKLTVLSLGSESGPSKGATITVKRDAVAQVSGLNVEVDKETVSGTSEYQTGITALVSNARQNNLALNCNGIISSVAARKNHAVYGIAKVVGADASAEWNYGGYYYGWAANGATIGTNYGLYTEGYGGTSNYGIYARATGGTTNYGVYATASGVGTTNWAVWSQGPQFSSTGTAWTTSDENLKSNIEDLSGGLETIMQLHPKTYHFRTDDYPYLQMAEGPQYGLLAQDMEQVVPDLVRDVHRPADIDSSGNELDAAMDFKAVKYEGLIPILIAAVQEQQATIAQMQEQINGCCSAQGQGMAPNNGDLKIAPAENVKEQRLMIIPNPVADLTRLEYYVPKAGKVSLLVSTSDGKPLSNLREELAEAGAYTYSWNTTKLAAGTYFCTFMLDGAVVVKRAVKVK